MNYTSFDVIIEHHIAEVSFNRPEKANSLHQPAWDEMKDIFESLDEHPEARVIILKGNGKHFCAGIDLELLMSMQQFQAIDCDGRKREALRKQIKILQDSITSIEKCRKPVIAAIHGACIGGAVDIVTACDMRFASEDATFSIREIDLGLVADIGTLQRLPKILNPGIVAEMAYTGRNVLGAEAKEIGLVNQCLEDKETLFEKVRTLAAMIASKSPLVVRGTKDILLYSRDHSVEDSLNYMLAWNAGMLYSNDLMEAFKANLEKRKPEFEN